MVNEGNNTDLDTIDPLPGGNGAFVNSGGTLGGNPSDGEDDSDFVPIEEPNENDCLLALTCPQGQVFDGASCSCKIECNTTQGYLHTSAFADSVGLGPQTITKSDNFRNALGAIIASTNCDSGKIFKNDQSECIEYYYRN